jgi:hypothetical protein
LAIASIGTANAQRQLLLNTKPGAPIQSTMYGIFFEDINFGADGGLYAELIENQTEATDITTGRTVSLKKDIKLRPRQTMILEF